MKLLNSTNVHGSLSVTGAINLDISTGTSFLTWTGSASNGFIKKVTDQGGVLLANDSSIFLHAGDNSVVVAASAGAAAALTEENLNLMADGNIKIAVNTQNGYTSATKFTISTSGFSGNSATSSKWATPRKLTIGNTSKNVDGSTDVSWTLAEIGALPTSGGAMTGSIGFNGGGYNGNAIKMETGDANGAYIGIGAGGLTVIGSGESTATVRANIGNGADEQMIVSGDSAIKLITNMQNGWASRKEVQIDAAGNISSSQGATFGGAITATRLQNNSSVAIHGDADASSTGEYVSIKAGHNELKVMSSAGGTTATTGTDKLLFNNSKVYHEGYKPQRLRVTDIRDTAPTPDSFATKEISTFFNNHSTYGGAWYSGITVGGWTAGYQVWQLSSYSSNSDSEKLYYRRGRGSTWGALRRIYHEGDKPSLSEIGASAINDAVQRWGANIKCATWSRVMALTGASVIGHSGILNIRGTRGNVVFNALFSITTSHSSNGTIVQIGNTSYSNFQIRLVVNTDGNGYVEVYDNANSATNSTSQGLNISYLNTSGGGLTKYTAFTDGTTIPSGYAERSKITTVSGQTITGSITGNSATSSKWQTARTLTIGNTGKSVDGSANVSWSHSEMGVVPASTGSSITIQADSDSSSSSEFLMLKAGHNELKVTSSAGGSTVTKGNDKLTFNGNVIYHAANRPNVHSGVYRRFTVGGTADNYYPVLITLGNDAFMQGHFDISRAYSWAAPDTWNTATHRGGLTLSVAWNGDSSWGGNQAPYYVTMFDETYCKMVGGMSKATDGMIVWLRGGGAIYQLNSSFGNAANAVVKLDGHTDGNKTTFSARTYNATTVDNEVKKFFSLRGTTVYDNNTRVYSPSNKPTSADVSDATNANSVNKIVKRDGSGGFSAGTITTTSLNAIGRSVIAGPSSTAFANAQLEVKADTTNGNARITLHSVGRMYASLTAAGSDCLQIETERNGYISVKNPNGYVNIGTMNTSYAHLQTDRGAFHFNKQVRVQGDIYAGTNYDQKVYHAGNKPTHLQASSTSRLASANSAVKVGPGIEMFLSTGSMTSNKPASDGYITEYLWDNSGGWSSQLYVPNTNGKPIQFRSMESGTWGSWNSVYSTNNKPTASDVGALSTSGGTVTGNVILKSGHTVHKAAASGGTSGYLKIAQIKITSSYMNQAFTINITQRGRYTSTLEVLFNNVSSSDPTLAGFYKIGPANAYIHKSATGTWDIYVQKSESYDSVDVLDYKKSQYLGGLNVTWTDSLVATLPTGYVAASVKTETLNITGTAGNASTLGGASASTAETANTIVKRSTNGDITARAVYTTNNAGLAGKKVDGTTAWLAYIGTDDSAYLGHSGALTVVASNAHPKVKVGASLYTMYHTGNKPTLDQLGAASSGHTHDGRYHKTIGDCTNFNNCLTQGQYTFGNTATNGPVSATYGILHVYVSGGGTHNNSSNWIWQVAMLTTTNKQYVRQKVNNGGWTTWTLMPVDSYNSSWNGGYVHTRTDGVTAVGKYLDFYATSGGSYSRLETPNGNYLQFKGYKVATMNVGTAAATATTCPIGMIYGQY